MTACAESDDLCTLDCSQCGTHNIVRAEPQGGFDEQPQMVVLRIARQKPESPQVFDETVDPDTDAMPDPPGKSN